MQNAMDIMAMVQKTSAAKPKFDVPSKTLGNENNSFKKEFSKAKNDITRDKSVDSYEAKANSQGTTEKRVEKLAKVMSSNNINTDIKEKLTVDVKEQTSAADAEVNIAIADEISEVEKLEEGMIPEEQAQSVLEMLQQLLQMMQGLKVEGVSDQKTAGMEKELQVLVQKLEQMTQMPIVNQTGELNQLLNSMKADLADLSELVKQLEAVQEFKLDPKEAEQLINQLTEKLNQAKSELHQILQLTEKPKETNEVLQQLSAQAMINESNETAKANNIAKDVKQNGEYQQIEATSTDKPADSKDSKNGNERNESGNQKEKESSYKSSANSELKQANVGDKPNQDLFSDMVAPQSDKANFQLNIKQTNANLQKESLVKFSASDIINQVVKKAEVIVQGSHQEMIMKLEPESLGKLNLKLVVENGLVTAKFIAESQQVKEVLESNFNQLKNALQEKGIAVQGLSVSVGQQGAEFKSGQSFDQWKKSIKITNKAVGDYMQLDEETNGNINPYSYHDGKVDYRA